jgi:hypothetical protein
MYLSQVSGRQFGPRNPPVQLLFEFIEGTPYWRGHLLLPAGEARLSPGERSDESLWVSSPTQRDASESSWRGCTVKDAAKNSC